MLLRKVILLFSVYLFSSLCFADNKQLANDISKVFANGYSNLNIGIIILDAKTGQTLYEKNPDRYLMPASNQKLFTAFAAYQYLPSSYTYQTYLFADLSKIKNGSINDNVYLKLTGDPTLTYAQLDTLLKSLVNANITHIDGSFVIDDSAFNNDIMSGGTSWDDSQYCFGAPLTASMVNHNCIVTKIAPGTIVGAPAVLQYPDYPQFSSFQNEVITGTDTKTPCKMHVGIADKSTFKITGCIRLTETPKPIEMAVQVPRENFAKSIVSILKKYNITVGQNIEFATINEPVKLLATNDSPPLRDLVNTMLKESDNIIANALFKTIGSFYTHQSGSWEGGSAALHAILKTSAGIDLPERALFDGAGNSRYNFLTARQIASLLQKIYQAPFANDLINALPISGIDGTLKDRMQSVELLGKIHAKTGTETAVTSLSGYIVTKNQKILIFAILINGFTDSSKQIKQLEDKICETIYAG